MPNRDIVLVTGATGKQGGSAVKALMKEGYRVRALTRNPSSKAALNLSNEGVEIAVGDMTHPESLATALRAVGTVFSMSTSFQAGHDGEIAQGINMIDAARAAGVSHFVFSSVASANRSTGIPHFETKYKVEQHLTRSGLQFTIIGPTAFMENFIQPFAIPALKQGKISRGLPASRSVQLVAVEDIGAFAAHVIADRERFLGKRIDIAGDEKTGDEAAEILSRAIGTEIKYEGFPPENLRSQNPDLAIMLQWQEKNNYSADIKALRRDYPEVGWHTFEEWAEQLDWKTILDV